MKTKEVRIGNSVIGGHAFSVMAGPCSIESHEQLMSVSHWVSELGAAVLRGGVFKMRTDPKSFQGLGKDALPLIREAKATTGLPFAVEVADPAHIELFADDVDVLQVGSRNMHNYYLLKELGKTRKPILLKRGLAAHLKEWILAVDYIVAGGNEDIILCERGIRTFEPELRNTVDLAGAVWAKQKTGLPVILDPSHGTGTPSLIPPMARAALAAGLDGIMVEVHPEPTCALSDGFQALDFPSFKNLMDSMHPIATALDRRIARQ
jgi:3-deoxy-7-phosphoheptulonate synthase